MKKPTVYVNAKNRLYPMGDMYGIFFEDINHAGDGGLYAEMVQNRSFEFDPIDNPRYDSMTAWEVVERDGGKMKGGVVTYSPISARNSHYYEMRNVGSPEGKVGLRNSGYNTGLPYRAGETYRFSMFARRGYDFGSPVEVRLESADGVCYGKAEIIVDKMEWSRYEAEITCDTEDFCGRLVVLYSSGSQLSVDMISLFPKNTFMNRENGLREDIASLLRDLKPSFIRFPGGCLVHDGELDPMNRDCMYYWKNTIGPVELRPTNRDNWGYNQTHGFGYYEFLCFCEDIGAKPVPVLPGGVNPHRSLAVPMEEMQLWIDDALDFIEFANGAPDTKWGKIRADMGHPEPFGVEYIAIGNEEDREEFFERYTVMHKGISEKHPEIKLLNTAGPGAEGKAFDMGWANTRENNSYAADEHYYVQPEWLIRHYDRYFTDFYRQGESKVFLGEYASWGNKLRNAIYEAAYMTSFELNADVVAMTCYAPLLCNADYVNWQPDLIWYNNHQIYGSPSYYVQKMYSLNKGDCTVEIEMRDMPEDVQIPTIVSTRDIENEELPEPVYAKRLYSCATVDDKANELIIKAVNILPEPIEVTIEADGIGAGARTVSAEKLTGKLSDTNTFDEPTKVSPVTETFEAAGVPFDYEIPAYSFVVLRIPMDK